MSIVRIEVTGQFATVYTQYDEAWKERVALIKSLAWRKFDQDGKCWLIEAKAVDMLKLLLEEFGDTVTVSYENYKTPTASTESTDTELRRLRAENTRLRIENTRLTKEAAAAGSNWADQFMSKCSPELRDKAYKQLLKVVHPDVGGSHVLMRDLNVARDRFAAERSPR